MNHELREAMPWGSTIMADMRARITDAPISTIMAAAMPMRRRHAHGRLDTDIGMI